MAKTINGMEFEISTPYAEGHVCSDIEARVLNQTRAENIGNNARAKIKEMQEGGSSEQEITDYVSELDAAYQFTAAGVRASRKLDPVEREAQKLARELIKTHLAASGRKLSTVPDGMTEEEWEDKLSAEIERVAGDEQIIKAATKNVAAKQKQAESLADALAGVSV